MNALRSALRVLVVLAVAAALVRKLAIPAEGPLLGGAWATALASVVEIVALALLFVRRDASAGLLLCTLCAGGILLAYLQPQARCGCLGAGVDRTVHLMFAGTLGAFATVLAWLACVPSPETPRRTRP